MKKKITFLMLMIFAAANIYSQNYTISFDASGTTNTLDSVKIINLTHPDTAMWHDGDIFQLQLNNAINDIEGNKENLHIFPNPMQGKTEIMFNVKQAGIASIKIYEITGKEIIYSDENLSQGNHQFQLSGLKQGAYFINIRGNGYFYSSKLISYNSFSNDINLKYNGVIQETNTNKYKTSNSSINFNFVSGDMLQFTGYAANLTDVFIYSPTSDISITFNFITSIPSVTTDTATSITNYTAICGGNVNSDGGEIVTERGICYATTTNPTITDNIVAAGNGTGLFTADLTGLTAGTTYYVRAYATNSVGTAYGNEVSFITNPISLPVLTTTNVSIITISTAISGGNISTDGGVTVTARGVCWSTSPNPTIALSTKTTNGIGTGSFTSNIIGLTAGTTYFVRAYATNSVGTAYGNEVSFTSIATIPNLTTSAITITQTTANSGGNISFDGGAAVTARGVCWSTIINPTVALSTKTTDGTGIGSFTSNITGLTANTTYYLRAYATNSKGTAYGNEVSFTSLSITPTLTTTATTNITLTTAISGGNISSEGNAVVSARGVCWSTTTNPTVALSTKTNNGSGNGSFTSNITGLTAGTTYYVRAYATNSFGTAYGNEISFTTAIKDYDGNIYDVVTIGTQSWMKQNMKTTHYRNGASIVFPGPIDTAWQNNTSGAYAWYNNNEATYKNTFGALYNWYAVNSGLLCPTGWHVPTDAEWTTLITYLGGINIAGGNLKATTLWDSPNTGASNSSGFTALPGGVRYAASWYNDIYENAYLWSSTESDTTYAWCVAMSHIDGYTVKGVSNKSDGSSVRCISNLVTQTSLPTISTTAVTAMTISTAISGGNITSDGGLLITARGVCWSTSSNPTVALSTKTTDGSGAGSYTSYISGLTAGTTYYVRAYATNSLGTAYGNVMSFTTITTPVTMLTDYDGNVYDTVHIGTQVWMKQNLKTTHYNDGTVIVYPGTDITAWKNNNTGAYAWYNNDPATYKNTYGALYNWYAINTGKLCPLGWHVPTDTEWTTLTTYLGGENIAGGKLKATTLWNSPNTGATNSSGFTALPGGGRDSDGTYFYIGYFGYWWSSTEYNTTLAWNRGINSDSNYTQSYHYNKLCGFSVRCLRNLGAQTSLPTITTSAVTAITATTANSVGNIIADGGAAVTERGMCWSTTSNPTVALSTKTYNGTGTGSFTSNITGLNAATTYYVRAYATNASGTAYGNEVSFITAGPSISTVTDIDGNVYDIVTIGAKVLMKQNLKTTHYNNGTPINYPGTYIPTWQYDSTGAYAWYNNDSATYKNTYGALYNWYAVNTGNLCPTGWHVPTENEWIALENYIGGSSIAGGKLKEAGLAHWNSPNTGAINSSGFTALPGGSRNSNGTYSGIGNYGLWWSSTQFFVADAYSRIMYYNANFVTNSTQSMNGGFSVRCIMD